MSYLKLVVGTCSCGTKPPDIQYHDPECKYRLASELIEKVEKYESLLHRIQLYSSVTMDRDKVGKLIRNIDRWSYAHRVGNGELSEEEQDEVIRKAFDKLLDVD